MSQPLSTLLPPAVTGDPELTATELPRAVLMRVNFIPGVRQRLAWRGIRECSGSAQQHALTARIAEFPGVFGLALEDSGRCGARGQADYALYYFPDPDEERVELLSVAAGVATQRDDFIERVREFAQDAELRALFELAQLRVVYDPGSGAVALNLMAPERLRLISADGVVVTGPEGKRELVAPGGIDQDMPALEVVYPLFRALAASLSFCLESAPVALQQRSAAGRIRIYSEQAQTCRSRRDPAGRECLLCLKWGGRLPLSKLAAHFPRVEVDWRAPAAHPAEYADEPWWQSRVPGARFSVDKSNMGISERPRLIILSGFLGAGKTSFLNHFIEEQARRNAFVAIVQNEIGARGLDSRLLGQHYAVTEMDEGCVCCTLAGNLKLALSEIAQGFQPDFVVVETTGLANPANLLSEISELEQELDFCSVTTLVDAGQGIAPLESYAVARAQLMLADVVILNKIDQAPAARRTELKRWVSALNPLATIHEAAYGDCSAAQLYGVNFAGRMRLPEIPADRAGSRATHADQGLASRLLRLDAPLDRERFRAATAALPAAILRIKGIVAFADEAQPLVYQYVPGSQAFSPLAAEDNGERFLVIIGEDPETAAAPLISALSGALAPPESCAAARS